MTTDDKTHPSPDSNQHTTPKSAPSLEMGIKAVGKIPSGLFVITCGPGSMGTGYLGSWVQQISFDPMIVAIAVKPQRWAKQLIEDHRHFCVNVLGAEDKDLMKHFARGFASDTNAFEGIAWHTGKSGVAVLDKSIANIECEWTGDSFQPGDHLVMAGRVISGNINYTGKPLTHVRTSGKDY